MIRDAVILGAGAAGLMCAMTAGRRGFSCAVIDHSPVAGRKVRLAGGGKGNVTNRYISSEWYVGEQKGFPDVLLKRCPTDFVLNMLTGATTGKSSVRYRRPGLWSRWLPPAAVRGRNCC